MVMTLMASWLLMVQDNPKQRFNDGKLKVGDVAECEIAKLNVKAKETVKLSDFKDVKPVVLIFGSYT